MRENLSTGDLVIVGIMIAGAFLGALACLRAWLRGHDSVNWPRVDGYLVDAEILYHEGRTSGYVPKLQYHYTVAGRTYHSSRLQFGSALMKRARAERILATAQAGPLEVYYSPSNPEIAVLIPGPDSGMLVGALVCAGLGLVLLASMPG